MMVVVRDYGFLTSSTFGLEAGKRYINDLLEDLTEAAEQHCLMRSYLNSNFGEIECSLLPRPNDEVANQSCSASG